MSRFPRSRILIGGQARSERESQEKGSSRKVGVHPWTGEHPYLHRGFLRVLSRGTGRCVVLSGPWGRMLESAKARTTPRCGALRERLTGRPRVDGPEERYRHRFRVDNRQRPLACPRDNKIPPHGLRLSATGGRPRKTGRLGTPFSRKQARPPRSSSKETALVDRPPHLGGWRIVS